MRVLGCILRWLGLIWLVLAVGVIVVGAWLTPDRPSLGDGLLLLPGFGALALAGRLMGPPGDRRRPGA